MTIPFSKPYPGGFRNKPDTTTPFTAAVGNTIQDTLQALVDAVNSGAGGGGGGAAVTDNGNGTGTLTSGTATDNGNGTATI